MSGQTREKIVFQMSSKILAELRSLSEREGRPLQELVNEALADLLEKRQKSKPRIDVMAAYQASHEKFETRYKKLAE